MFDLGQLAQPGLGEKRMASANPETALSGAEKLSEGKEFLSALETALRAHLDASAISLPRSTCLCRPWSMTHARC